MRDYFQKKSLFGFLAFHQICQFYFIYNYHYHHLPHQYHHHHLLACFFFLVPNMDSLEITNYLKGKKMQSECFWPMKEKTIVYLQSLSLQRCVGFPHQAGLQFSVDPIWVSYNSICQCRQLDINKRGEQMESDIIVSSGSYNFTHSPGNHQSVPCRSLGKEIRQ